MIMINDNVPIEPIVLGKIGSCYGIRGWLKLFSFTENIENIFCYQPWFIYKSNCWRKINLENWCYHNQSVIIKLKEANDRNSAKLLTNCKIFINSSQLPMLENGNYYWKDLINFQVINTKGCNLGKVINIIETGSNDVLVIKKNLKDTLNIKEYLVPFLYENIIKKVNFTTKSIIINWSPDF